VASGARLTIEPGVQVRFNGWYLLRIEGNIQATGSSHKPILFTSNLTPQKANDWAGIYLYQSTGSQLSWAIIEYPEHGVGIQGGTGNTINNCIIRYCAGWGSYLVNNDPLVYNNYIHDTTGGGVQIAGNASFMNNTVENVGYKVIEIAGGYPVINQNNLLPNPNIAQDTIKVVTTTGIIDGRYNYWGTQTTTEMNAKGAAANIGAIYDFYDDPTLARLDYSNWLSAPNSNAYPNPNALPKFHPFANAGADKVVLDTAKLDGSASYDPDGQVVSYQWSLKHRTNSAYDRTASGITPTLSTLNPGFYDVTLIVADNDGLTGTDTMLLAAAGQGTWPNPNTNIDVSKFKMTKDKRTGITTTSMHGTIDLPALSLVNGNTVNSRMTIELFGALPGGVDLIMSEDTILKVRDTKKELTISK